MLQLISNLLSRWRSDPAPQWAARSPRQRAEVAYLWLLQSRAQCDGSHLRDLHILPGENAGQKKRPALIVHCQTAEEVGVGAAFFRADIQIHLEADFRKKRGADSFDQHRAALIIGEVSAMLSDIALCKELLNDATLDERPFSHFHLVRHLEGQSIGVPIGGSIMQDTLTIEAWFHTYDYQPDTSAPSEPIQLLLGDDTPAIDGTVADESGTGNPGALIAAGCGYVDGELFTVGFAPALLQSRAAFSMAIFWETGATLTDNVGVIGGDLSANTLPTIRVNSNGSVELWANIGASVVSITSATGLVTVETTHHFAATYDGTALVLYIDGVAAGSVAATGSTHATATGTRIGGGQNGSLKHNDNYFFDARIYGVPLTAAQVASIAAAAEITPQPVAWWPVCELGGAVLHDVSGAGNHITATIGASFWTASQDVFFYLAAKGGTAEPYRGATGVSATNTRWIPALADGSADAAGDPIGEPAGPYIYAGRDHLDTIIGESDLAAGDDRSNPAFARSPGGGRSSRLVTYGSTLAGVPLAQARDFAPADVHTIAPGGVWSWFTAPPAVIQSDGTILAGYVVPGSGEITAAVYDPAARSRTEILVGDATEDDDHNNIGFATLASGQLLLSYSRHNADNLTRYRTTTALPVTGIGDLSAEDSVNNGANSSYASPLTLSTGETFAMVRVAQQWGFLKTTDNAASFDPFAQLYTSNNNANCYSHFTVEGEKLWIAATNAYPNGFATSLYAFYVLRGNIYEPDGTLIAAVSAAPITLEDLAGTSAEVYAYTAAAIDIADGIAAGRAWGWDLKIVDGKPVVAYHLELLGNPTYSGDGSTVYRTDADRIYYYAATYTGGEWVVDFIAHGGYGVSPYSPGYSGGIAIDPRTAGVYYYSSSSADPTSRSATDPGLVAGQAIYQASKAAVWTYDELVPRAWLGYSTFRPYVITDGGTTTYLLYCDGYYDWYNADRYSTAIRAIEI